MLGGHRPALATQGLPMTLQTSPGRVGRGLVLPRTSPLSPPSETRSIASGPYVSAIGFATAAREGV